MLGIGQGLLLPSGVAAAGRVAPPRLLHGSVHSRHRHGSQFSSVVAMAKRVRKSTTAGDAGEDEGAAAAAGNDPSEAPKPAAASRKGRKRKTTAATEAAVEPIAPDAADAAAGAADAAVPVAASEGSLEGAAGEQQIDNGNIAEQQEAAEADAGEGPTVAGHAPSPEPRKSKRSSRGKMGRPRNDEQQEQDSSGEPAAPERPVSNGGDVDLSEAVTLEQEKEDSRRFAYHRRLYSAARAGEVEATNNVLLEMQSLGMQPGPAALHALLFAHTKAGDVDGGLQLAARAADAGVKLLAESYQALIFAALDQEPPDTELAMTLLTAAQEAEQDPIPAWRTLVTRLWVKGQRQEAMAQAKEGLAQGWKLDSDVAEVVVNEMCADGNSVDEAFEFVMSLPELGIQLEGRLYNPLVRALARSGDVARADLFMDDMYLMEAAAPPNVDTFNALLDGLVHIVSSDETSDATVLRLERFREEVLKAGLRPNRHTFRLLCEGAIKLRDTDAALTAFEAMRAATGVGGSRLLSDESLSSLQLLLAAEDKPYDLLKVLDSMSEDQVPLPPQAMQPSEETGLTILSSWIKGHMEQMAARGAGQPMGILEGTAANMRYINDVPIGAGDCAVTEQGIILQPGKMTMQQIRAEAEARGIPGAMDKRRPELMVDIKAARDALPLRIKDEQAKLQQQLLDRRRDEAMASGRTMDEEDAPKPTGKKLTKSAMKQTGVIVVEGTIRSWRDGKLVESRPVREERSAGKYFRVRTEKDRIEGMGNYQSNVAKATKELDLEATLTGGDLEEGVSDILNLDYEDYEDAAMEGLSGTDPDAEQQLDDGDDDDEEGSRSRRARPRAKDLAREADEESGPSASLMLTHFDNRSANMSAGMSVAMDILRLVEQVGGSPTPEDLVVLTNGALTERHAAAAMVLAPRLHRLATEGGQSEEYVAGLHEKLARMCLEAGEAAAADVVIEEAERRGYQLSEDLLQQLQAAMGGQLRRKQVESRRAEALRGLVQGGEQRELELDVPEDVEEQEEGAEGAATAATAATAADSAAIAASRSSSGQQGVAVLDAEALDAREEEVQQQGEEGAAATDAADADAEYEDIVIGEDVDVVEWPEEMEPIYEKDGVLYQQYVPEEGEELVLDAGEMWQEERESYRQLLSDMGADEVLGEAEMDEIIEDPIALPNYRYLPAALEQYKQAAEMGDKLRQELAEHLLERFGEEQLEQEGALELVKAWAGGNRLEGEEGVAYEEWKESLEAVLQEMPDEDLSFVDEEGSGSAAGEGEEGEEDEEGQAGQTSGSSGLQQQQQQQQQQQGQQEEGQQEEEWQQGQQQQDQQQGQQEEEWQEGEEEQEEEMEEWEKEAGPGALLDMLDAQLTDEVLERFVETGSLDIPLLDETLSEKEAAEIKSRMEAAFGQLPPDLLNALNNLGSGNAAEGPDGEGFDAEALARDEDEWEDKMLELLEARFKEAGLSLEDALDEAIAGIVEEGMEGMEDMEDMEMEAAGAGAGAGGERSGGSGTVGALGGRCRVAGRPGAAVRWLWLGRSGWAPVAVNGAARLRSSSSTSSSRRC